MGVLILLIGLWAHVSWRSYIIRDLRFLFAHELAKPKISNLGSTLAEEYVGSLQISVYYIILLYAFIALDYIFDQCHSFDLIKWSVILNIFEEIAAFAKLGYDVDVVFSHKNVDSVENIGMFEQFQRIHLVIQQIVLDFVLYFG